MITYFFLNLHCTDASFLLMFLQCTLSFLNKILKHGCIVDFQLIVISDYLWSNLLGNRICRSPLPYAAAFVAIISRCKSTISCYN